MVLVLKYYTEKETTLKDLIEVTKIGKKVSNEIAGLGFGDCISELSILDENLLV